MTGRCITSCLYRNGNRDFSATCRSASAAHREQWEPLDSGLPQEDPQESKLLGATVGHSLQDTCCCSTTTSLDRDNEAEKVTFLCACMPKETDQASADTASFVCGRGAPQKPNQDMRLLIQQIIPKLVTQHSYCHRVICLPSKRYL